MLDYKAENNGELPSSLNQLELDRSDVDLTPFRIVDPEVRKGELGKGIIIEVEQAGSGKGLIVIYQDGRINYE